MENLVTTNVVAVEMKVTTFVVPGAGECGQAAFCVRRRALRMHPAAKTAVKSRRR